MQTEVLRFVVFQQVFLKLWISNELARPVESKFRRALESIVLSHFLNVAVEVVSKSSLFHGFSNLYAVLP